MIKKEKKQIIKLADPIGKRLVGEFFPICRYVKLTVRISHLAIKRKPD